jgi:hypothetical protein
MSREVVEREMMLADEGDRPAFTFIRADHTTMLAPPTLYKEFLKRDNPTQEDAVMRIILNESWRAIGVFNAKVWTSKMNAYKKGLPRKHIGQVRIDGNLYCLKRLQWFTRQYKRVADEMIVFKMNQNNGKDVPLLFSIENEAIFIIAPRVLQDGMENKDALVLLEEVVKEPFEEMTEDEEAFIEEVVDGIVDALDDDDDAIIIDDEELTFNPITGEFE